MTRMGVCKNNPITFFAYTQNAQQENQVIVFPWQKIYLYHFKIKKIHVFPFSLIINGIKEKGMAIKENDKQELLALRHGIRPV